VSALISPSLSIVTATPATASRPATRASLRADRALVQNALGPDERLLAMLPGGDAHAPSTWLVTNVRLVMLCTTGCDEQITSVSNAAVCCVEQRTDPMGTWLRVRATGRQYTLSNIDPVQAAQFCAVLRERAGIGAVEPPARRPSTVRGGMRTGSASLMVQSPR
jgi:hypothetical protein